MAMQKAQARGGSWDGGYFRCNIVLRNVVLVIVSILAVFLVSVAGDRALGLAGRGPRVPGAMELLFPPHSEQSFATHEFAYTAHINALGLRDREIPPKRRDTFRIIAIGDSYTYGWGVEIEDTWLRRLEARLRAAGHRVETINLGKPGIGPPDYAQLAEKVIPLLRPDLVIVGMLMGNDLAAVGPEVEPRKQARLAEIAWRVYPNIIRLIRDLAPVEDARRTHDMMPPQRTSAEDNRRWTANTARQFLEKMSPEHRTRFDTFEDAVKEAFLSGNLNPYMIDLAMQNPRFYMINLDWGDPWTQTCIERLTQQFMRIRRAAERDNARVVVVHIPDGPYVNEHALRNIRRVGYETTEELLTSDTLDRAVAVAGERAGLTVYSVTEIFRERRDDPTLFYELDGHFTPAGHALFAEAIAHLIAGEIGDSAQYKD